MKVYTRNSVYEVDEVNKKVRRTAANHELRRDEDWLQYHTIEVGVGQPMTFILESLAGDADGVTIRTTSTVLRIEN